MFRQIALDKALVLMLHPDFTPPGGTLTIESFLEIAKKIETWLNQQASK